MATITSNSAIQGSVSFGSVIKAALIGAGIAAVGNLALLLLADVLNIQLNVMVGPPSADAPTMPIGPLPVIIFNLVPALMGGLLCFVLTKTSTKAATVFTMHLLAASAITWALTTHT